MQEFRDPTALVSTDETLRFENSEQATIIVDLAPGNDNASHAGARTPLQPFNWRVRTIKRSMDIIVALVALVVLAPLFCLTAVAILVESGRPILFRQDRLGLKDRPFQIFKFRSMHVTENGARVDQARRGDPRITAFGRMIRRTSIDEIAQLFNVLRGDMTLIGPRPHAIAHDRFYDKAIADYALRRLVKPGITGWAQVNGLRGNTEDLEDMRARVEHDLWYIAHWSLWLDIRILFATAIAISRHDAY